MLPSRARHKHSFPKPLGEPRVASRQTSCVQISNSHVASICRPSFLMECWTGPPHGGRPENEQERRKINFDKATRYGFDHWRGKKSKQQVGKHVQWTVHETSVHSVSVYEWAMETRFWARSLSDPLNKQYVIAQPLWRC